MFKQFRELTKGEFIVVGVDPAAGGGDSCAAQFISKTRIDVPLVYRSSTMATEMTNALVPRLEEIHKETGIKPVVAYERANGGVFELERLAMLNREGHYTLFRMPSIGKVAAETAVRYGWDTNTATRPAMLSQLKEAIDFQLLNVYDKQTIEEMYSFVVVKTSSSWKAQAEQGSHDDLVMALAIAWQLYQLCDAPVEKNTTYTMVGGDPITGFGRRRVKKRSIEADMEAMFR